ncbi:hypothetical protein GF406_02730 [candidate division KSB1 bacterium]|nr:hypothetical protein [candidate division KSB1 bacterium]
MKSIWIVWIVLFCGMSSVWAQRQGAMEMGGSFSFRNMSSADQETRNLMSMQGVIGYYLGPAALVELEPTIDLVFNQDQTQIQTSFLVGPSIRVVDMAPDYYRRPQYRKRDLGVVAAVFASAGVGFWSEGISQSNTDAINETGAAVSAGLGTHSSFGKSTLLRTKAQILYLFPGSNVITSSRTIFQVSVGFSVFVKF